MPAHSSDREVIGRLSIVLTISITLFAGFFHLNRMYGHKFNDATGQAEWIWARTELSRDQPLAFFAVRDFDLPASRLFTRIKIAADPEYALFFNGREIGGRRQSERVRLDTFDVSPLARDGRNRIVVAVRSTNGVGGLIAAVDIAPEVENYVITDGGWKIFRAWHPDIALRDARDEHPEPPMLFGEPPLGRWNYLETTPGRLEPPAKAIAVPLSATRMKVKVVTVKPVGGIAVVGTSTTGAIAFDFGRILDGRVRLTLAYASLVNRRVNVRLANTPGELTALEGGMTPFVFAAGERTVVDPEVRHFRYALVYGGQARVDALE
ncbi:MAG TPA: hypothetical protein VJ276_13455 [Thermoanaerobaculia bacterium]|nr:hypothetical protein [Thermoanaerobaculia bacterium]